jgi:hypothetical protein
MSWLPEDLVSALRSSSRIGIFFHLATDPDLRLWSGSGNSPAMTMFGTDLEAGRWLGAGRLLSLPDLDVLINGQTEEMRVGLSGVDDAHIAQITAGAPAVAGKAARFGVATFDERWQPTSAIVPIWRGAASHWTPESKPITSLDKNPQSTITLTLVAGDVGRSRMKGATFTPSWQAQRSAAGLPPDRFFDRVVRYVQNYLPGWPRLG